MHKKYKKRIPLPKKPPKIIEHKKVFNRKKLKISSKKDIESQISENEKS